MKLDITDPLFLLSAESGLSVTQLNNEAAEGNPGFTEPQTFLKTGEPIPIVFCERRTIDSVTAGGVFVMPKATEGFFRNSVLLNTTVEPLSGGGVEYHYSLDELVTIRYHLVVSEGDIGTLQLNDLFYGPNRIGSWVMAYNARASTWEPGNEIDNFIDVELTENSDGDYDWPSSPVSFYQYKAGGAIYMFPEASTDPTVFVTAPHKERVFPTFCGTSGSYSGLTTLSFSYTFKNREEIDHHVNIFVRQGMEVTRLLDDTVDSSDNYADLAKYLMTQNNRLASDLIDNDSLIVAANFTETNQFHFNGIVSQSENLLDWLQRTSEHFLLRLTNTGGKLGLIPRVPYNTDYTIKTTQITPEFTFTEDHVVPGGFEIEYISLEDREPVCFVVSWRQQPDDDFGLVRTLKVKYENQADDGPFVNIDMSNYCVKENHAAKVGAYKLAQRQYIAHQLRLTVREQSYNTFLAVGDIVRVRLRRETKAGEEEYFDKMHEINRISRTFNGSITYDLTHFPIDSQGRSLVALAVNAAVGAGNVIDVGRSDYDGDDSGNTSATGILRTEGDVGNPPSLTDTQYEAPEPTEEDSSFPADTISTNPVDPFDDSIDEIGGFGGNVTTISGEVVSSFYGYPETGDILAFDPAGIGGPEPFVVWKEDGVEIDGASGLSETLTITSDMIGSEITAEAYYPDPGSSNRLVSGSDQGYGEPVTSPAVEAVNFVADSAVVTGYTDTPAVGDDLAYSPACAGAFIEWYKIDVNTGLNTLIGSGIGATLAVTQALLDEGVQVVGIGKCPNGDYTRSDTVNMFGPLIECPGGSDSGGQGTFSRVIDVGTAYPASFTFTYTAFVIKDRFVISGAATFDTGFVSGENLQATVQKTSANRYITVTVYAPTSGTAWEYSVGCAS